MLGYFGPKGQRRREAPVTAPPVPTQDELRDRRRRGLIHVYRGDWSLHAEVHAICTPVADRLTLESNAPVVLPTVQRIADAVHTLVSEVVALIARSDAEDRAEHLRGTDEYGRSIRLLVDLAERPECPEIAGDDLADGSWSAVLIDMARPYSERLDTLLRRANPPGMMRGALSVSERLEEQLRAVDRAVLELARKLDDAAAHRQRWPDGPPVPANAAKVKAAAARAELAALGIDA